MYRIGIIGLGSIAARYSNPSAPHPYCHTGGIRQCEATDLVAVADPSENRKTEFKETWGPGFPDRSINYYATDIECSKMRTWISFLFVSVARTILLLCRMC